MIVPVSRPRTRRDRRSPLLLDHIFIVLKVINWAKIGDLSVKNLSWYPEGRLRTQETMKYHALGEADGRLERVLSDFIWWSGEKNVVSPCVYKGRSPRYARDDDSRSLRLLTYRVGAKRTGDC